MSDPAPRAWWTTWRPSLLAGGIAFVAFWSVTQAVAVIALHTGVIPFSVSALDAFSGVWVRWDAGWYLLIANSGYAANTHVQTAPGFYQDAAAFAPLYPLLIRIVAHVLPLSNIGAGSLVTAVALLSGLVVVHRLARLDLDLRGADLALLLLLVFPSALFLHALYADSLLLLCVAAALLAARTRRWWIASAFAGAAVLTKVYAVIIVVALVVEYMESRGWSPRRVRLDALAVVAGPVIALGGLALYMQTRLGDALRFIHAESLWLRRPAAPWTAVTESFTTAARGGTEVSQRVLAGFETLSPFLLIAAAVYAWLRAKRSYAALMLLAALVFMSSSTLQSTGRYALTIVPLFIAAAMWLRSHLKLAVALAAVSAALGAYFLREFALNRFAG